MLHSSKCTQELCSKQKPLFLTFSVTVILKGERRGIGKSVPLLSLKDDFGEWLLPVLLKSFWTQLISKANCCA